ncbi:hypothetical protein ACJ41O_010101 [Fusarium nematophilum]
MANLWVQHQPGLDMVGVGSCGLIYEVDCNTILKAGRVYQPPEVDADHLEKWYYASESIFHSELIENEREVFQKLERNPHPNLAQPIDVTRPEGNYIRRYASRSEGDKYTRPQRMSLYLDLLRGLSHLHSLEIAHSDMRLENVLFDTDGRAVICDFSAAAAFGQPNPASSPSSYIVPANGLSKSVSDATDRFAFASLMFRLETGMKPALSVGADGTLILPHFASEHSGIGRIIKKAWLGIFTSTSEMLRSIQFLAGPRVVPAPRQTTPTSVLRESVARWREERIARHGL